MRKLLLAIFACLPLLAGTAFAASVVVNGVIQSPASTSVTCTPVATTLTFPVAANSLVCPIAVSPAGWSGAVTVSHTTHFTTGTSSGVLYLETGGTSPPVGPISVTVTSTP